LVVTPDTIVVKSPGGPVPPITLEQMQSFSAPMLSRNPVLHYVFARMELAEERGLGLKSMRNDAQRAHLPLPKYTWEDPYLVLTIYRSESGAVGSLDADTLASLNKGRTIGVEVVDDPRDGHVRRIRRCAEDAEPDCTEPFEALHSSRVGAEAGFGTCHTLRGCQDVSRAK
jgi:hypothetical protein